MTIGKDFSVVLATAPSAEQAEKIARAVVESRLAACVNIVPGIRSIYRWKGEVCDDTEILLIIKTQAALFEQLSSVIGENHPYETPEIISLPISAGWKPYLAWLDAETAVQNEQPKQ
ncbi:MAG: divalent-cation tolerance protein CutA [Nitrospirae bacterium]|nr:divalent-cation tolerance protein CutA [Nitrospirota bacterium]